MMNIVEIALELVIWLFLIYGAAVVIVYGWIGIYAFGAVLKYKKHNTFTDYSIIASNPNAPKFSIIAPAYNEGVTIVENVRSLLSLYYHNMEIIIVNDGSKDDSMQKLIDAYELEVVSFFVQSIIETNKVRGVYKSKNPAFRKLIVVDKENGGKADALNVGVNISTGDYLVCIDVDCILEQDSMLKIAKPFLEQTTKKVIACGGVIRLANNCKIVNGKIVEVNIPKTLLGRTQALEYIRAFVLGRMAWSRASGLILISGAFGVFDRKIVLNCGGYDRKTVGEDMELVVRMRKYMEEQNEPYEVVTIPDPLCWTEAPETKEILRKQRNRWMRGTMETLWKHKGLMFNPKYGKLGIMSLPYWFFFEFLGPLVEFLGYFIFILLWFMGVINMPFFLVFFFLVISTGFLFSIYAILVDVISHQVYKKKKDFTALIGTAILEPFYFHPMVVKAAVNGFFDYFKNTHSWGDMTRQGFNQSLKDLPLHKKISAHLAQSLKEWSLFAVVFIFMFLLGVVAEWGWYQYHFPNQDRIAIGKTLIYENLVFIFRLTFGLGIFYIILNFIHSIWSKYAMLIAGSIVLVSQFLLFVYFSESRNLLGADLFFYTQEELLYIVQTSGMLSILNVVLLLLLILLCVVPLWFAQRKFLKNYYVGISVLLIGIVFIILPKTISSITKNELDANASKSKWNYFLASNFDNYLNSHPEISDLIFGTESYMQDETELDKEYPFWKKDNTNDFLGTYLNKSDKTPNLVFVILEGMGHAYSSPHGYIGNFTPFLNSLKSKSLYWENNVSSSGRTFSVIPTIIGSLPFGKNGFMEMENLPLHFNLYNIFKENNFSTGFFYGGNSEFDRTRQFLEFSEVETIVDEFTYDNSYKKLPSKNGESWGYEDQAVFEKMLKTRNGNSKPYFDVILTLSTHSPFLINNSSYFEKKYQDILSSNSLKEDQKQLAKEHKKQLVSVLNADDALKVFFDEYKKRSDFKNTIFVITGDHSMPEIVMQSKIDRFRVPLLIYSPLLKESKQFRKMSSHFDIAPSIVAYYRDNYNLNTPASVAWVSSGLRPNVGPNDVGIAMMKSKSELINYTDGEYHIEGENAFSLSKNLSEEPLDNNSIKERLNKSFSNFKNKNQRFFRNQKLIPDSVYTKYRKK